MREVIDKKGKRETDKQADMTIRQTNKLTEI